MGRGANGSTDAAVAGGPDVRSPARYLWWLLRSQRALVVAGACWSSLWLVGLTLPPYVLSRAIDDGLTAGRAAALLGWSAVLAAVGLGNALVAMMRHRTMSRIRMESNFRTVRVLIEHAIRLGSALSGRRAAGEVVTIGVTDVMTISMSLTISGLGVGSVIAYAVIAVLLFQISGLLALVVLIGVPVLVVLVGPLLGRLQARQSDQRRRQGELTARLVDVLAGLPVLNALGGKDNYAARYRTESAAVRRSGERVGAVTSWIDGLGVGVPALFLAVVTWLAARMAVEHRISVGELVAVYGYAAVLVMPVSFFIEGAHDLVVGLVAARRVVDFLGRRPPGVGNGRGMGPGAAAELHDRVSGVRVRPGVLTAVTSARPSESAAVLERLAGFADGDVTWGGQPLAAVDPAQVRRRVLLADNDAELFAGSLREVLTCATEAGDDVLRTALHAAAAEDLAQGSGSLDRTVAAHGANLSGGQRQRVRLARALVADPEVLVAVEPTSALDVHTETLVAQRLRVARTGRTTVLATMSPVLLAAADTVILLVDGRAAAVGPHARLLMESPVYRSILVPPDDPDTATTAADEAVRAP